MKHMTHIGKLSMASKQSIVKRFTLSILATGCRALSRWRAQIGRGRTSGTRWIWASLARRRPIKRKTLLCKQIKYFFPPLSTKFSHMLARRWSGGSLLQQRESASDCHPYGNKSSPECCHGLKTVGNVSSMMGGLWRWTCPQGATF